MEKQFKFKQKVTITWWNYHWVEWFYNGVEWYIVDTRVMWPYIIWYIVEIKTNLGHIEKVSIDTEHLESKQFEIDVEATYMSILNWWTEIIKK